MPQDMTQKLPPNYVIDFFTSSKFSGICRELNVGKH